MIWPLVPWVSGKIQGGFHVDNFPTALLGGLIVRASVFVLPALGPRPVEQAP